MNQLQIDLYSKLYLARAAERGIMKYYHENDMKTPMHMSYGQELVPVGICHALRKEDQVFGTYRSHALYLAKSGNLVKFFGEMYGKINGMVNGKAGSMHMSDAENGFMGSSAIVASTIPLAIGAAFANKFNGTDRIVVPFFGDGAIDEGDFWESLNIAASKKLPVLFVLEDNNFAVHTHKSNRHGYDSITEVVKKFNLAYVDNVYTNYTNVDGIYAIAQKSIELMKQQNKPAFLCFHVERGLEHVGVNSDYDAGYRQLLPYQNDCVVSYRDNLTSEKAEEIELQIDAMVEDAIYQAKSANFPSNDELYKGVYA